MNLDQALATFFEESRELLEQMESLLLAAENAAAAADDLHALFRCAHTIKGSAGLFGLDEVVRFTHQVESVLDRLRNGEIAFDPALIALLLECRDHIGGLIGGDAASAAHGAVLAERLQAYLGMPSVPAETTEPVTASGGGPVGGAEHWHLSLRFGADILRNGMDPLVFIRYLGNYGEIVHLETLHETLPAWPDYDPESCWLGFEIDLASAAGKAQIEGVFDFVADDASIRILPPHSKAEEYVALIETLPEGAERVGEILVAAGTLTRHELDSALAAQREARAAAAASGPLGEILVDSGVVHPVVVDAALDKQKRGADNRRREARSVKVPSERLDELIDLVGELVIAAATSQLLADRARQPPLVESTANLLRLVEDIRDTALRLRMVPIGEVFSRFPRVVRDAAKEMGKEIDLKILGAETELDKSMVEKIADPLTHMVRNAIDHGIEAEAKRLARGKPGVGTVRLIAYHESGGIVVEVADDGGGLDCGKILAKARERGLVGPEDNLSRAEIFRLILEPGFSTAERVTNLSGRGVGMDVVKKGVEALRGRLDIDSEPGEGTIMRICLPLTLAIIDGFQVALGKSVFIVPLDAVVECIELPADNRAGYLDLRDEVLPLIDLEALFDIVPSRVARRNVVVVKSGPRKAGLVVDRLLGEFQTVIKPMSKIFGGLKGIGGSTILGSGEVALILDVPALVQVAANAEARSVLAR